MVVLKVQVDPNQYGSVKGTSTTDALADMVHKWYQASDVPETFTRVLLLDYTKAFDLINHEILITKLHGLDIPPHIVRWMAAFLLDRTQTLKVGDFLSEPGQHNGGIPQGTLSGPKIILIQINDLKHLVT